MGHVVLLEKDEIAHGQLSPAELLHFLGHVLGGGHRDVLADGQNGFLTLAVVGEPLLICEASIKLLKPS